MPQIIWKGFSRKPFYAPDEPLPTRAVKLELPRRHFWIHALLLSSPLYLPIIASLYLKSYATGITFIDKPWVAIGLLSALFLSPVHEWLHCLPYPRTAMAYIGILPTRLMAYMTCKFPISRRNEMISSLLPVLLGIIPWFAFLCCPATQSALASFCWGLAVMGVMSPCPDYLHAYYVWKSIPKHAYIQGTNHGTSWFMHPLKQQH